MICVYSGNYAIIWVQIYVGYIVLLCVIFFSHFTTVWGPWKLCHIFVVVRAFVFNCTKTISVLVFSTLLLWVVVLEIVSGSVSGNCAMICLCYLTRNINIIILSKYIYKKRVEYLIASFSFKQNLLVLRGLGATSVYHKINKGSRSDPYFTH